MMAKVLITIDDCVDEVGQFLEGNKINITFDFFPPIKTGDETMAQIAALHIASELKEMDE